MNPLIENMRARTGKSRKVCTYAVEMFTQDIIQVLEEHGRCRVPGLGVLKITERKARKARNPKTGETVHVPAKKTIRFYPNRLLVQDLNA